MDDTGVGNALYPCGCNHHRHVPEIFDQGPVVMLGDFNANTIWNKTHPKHLNHSSLVERLANRGIVSVYHHVRGESQGKESEANFFTCIMILANHSTLITDSCPKLGRNESA